LFSPSSQFPLPFKDILTPTPPNTEKCRIKNAAGETSWVDKDSLKDSERLAREFLFSPSFERLVIAKNYLPSLYTETVELPAGVTELTYRFASNGAYFGIRQYLGVFTPEFLHFMEEKVDLTMLQAIQGTFRTNTSDYQPNMKRSKFFFGYGYVGYQYGKKPLVRATVVFEDGKPP